MATKPIGPRQSESSKRRASTGRGERSNGPLTGAARPATDATERSARESDAVGQAQLDEVLAALRAVRSGDFSARLNTRRSGLLAEIASEFNELAATNQWMSNELVRSARHFSDEDLVVLELSADRAAIAIEHALSYEREHGLVKTLQHHLLPERLPQFPGLVMAARYRPGERAAQVGGDWYDAIALPDGSLGLVIGDVVGHGIGAATMMGELRAALRAYAVTESGSPGRALMRLNSLVASTHGAMVATLLYLVIDADGSRVVFASAGHPPPLLMTSDGRTRFLNHRFAAPLGATEYPDFKDWRSELAPGSTVLLYTDGLVERRRETIDVGLERLSRALSEGPADLEQLCSSILAQLQGGTVIQDDIALLAIRRLEQPCGVLDLELPAEPESVPLSRHRLERWLSETDASPDDIFGITLAANEACTNAIEHAYGPERGFTFTLRAEHSSDVIALDISDSGRWRTPRGSQRGRGLRIIEQLMDAVEVQRTATGTTVRMRKALARHERT